MNRIQAVACVCAAAALTAACEKSQSSNPLSPTVAGPIPWVKLTTPHVVNPAAGQRIRTNEQPITLILENASTNGPRPLSYVFEVATDVTFTNKVFVRDGVTPGEGGRTSVRLPDPLAPERTYYWRARAEDGANTGEYTPPIHFAIFTPVILGAPQPRSPIDNAVATTIRPQLSFAAASRSGPFGAIGYEVHLSDSDAFPTLAGHWMFPEAPGLEPSVTPTSDLAPSRQYFWRVRAYDQSTSSPWSATQVFRTPAAVTGGSPGGGGVGGTGASFDQLGNVIIVGGSPDVRGWAVTSQITQLGFANHMIYLNHTKLGQWPGVDIGGALQESTLWVFFKINGQWYATGAERWRPNQTEKALYSPTDISTGWFYNNNWSPMWNYIPSPGEQVGFMVVAGSTRLDNNAPAHERSNILLIPWPATTPAYFP